MGGICTSLATTTFVAGLGAMAGGTFMSMTTWPKLSWTTLALIPLIIGVIIGTLLTCLLHMEVDSRKRQLALVSIPFVIFWIFTSLTFVDYNLWMITLLAGGVATGALLVLGPIYVAEISPVYIRGLVFTLFPIMFHLGFLYSYVAGPNLNPMKFVCTSCFIPILFGFFLVLTPDSPFLLLQMDDDDTATSDLKKLRMQENVDEEVDEISTSLADNNDDEYPYPSALFRDRNHVVKVIIAMSLMLLQQFSGIAGIIVIARDKISDIGIQLQEAPNMIILTIILILGNMICMAFVDFVGRRALLLLSSIGVTVFLVLIAFFNLSRTTTLCIALGHMVFFSLGLGPLPLLITREMFTTTNCVCPASFVVSTFAVTYGIVRTMCVLLTPKITYGICAVVSGLGILLHVFVLVEMKGRMLDCMDRSYYRTKRGKVDVSNTSDAIPTTPQ